MYTKVCYFEIDGLIAEIECYQANLMGKWLTYNARIYLRLAEPDPWTGALRSPSIVAKSFGNVTAAEDWLLDHLENPSFLLLKFG